MALITCPECGKQISDKAKMCVGCGFPISDYLKRENVNNNYKTTFEKQFNGIYKYTLFKGKQEVYCPRCNSENCSHYKQQKIIPEKTKTKYTANLNPLKPFTLVNKKEKVVRKEFEYTENKIICNNCGYIFD